MMGLIEVEVEDAVGVVYLSRAERRNAITGALVKQLNSALDELMDDERVRVVLVAARGEAFSVGDDLHETFGGELAPQDIEEFLNDLQSVSRRILFSPKPVLSAVNGWCVGGAFSWTVNADFSYWGEGARGLLPEIRYGISVTGALTYLLPHTIGHSMAMELLTIDAPISARRLHQLGLCHAVIPDDDVFSAALSHARKLSESSTEALAVVKGGLNRNRLTAINEALEAEKEACLMTFSTSEVLDAVAAQVRRMYRRSTG